MASNIKGITIEIGGDTSKLSSALSATDGVLKKTQTSLKDINKLLKLDPGNTELLTQKQKNLQTAISETKNRLDTLKTAQEQMAGKDLTAEEQAQYEALQREIIATEQQLKNLESEMKSFGSVGAQQVAAVGKKWEEVGEKISAAGEKISSVGQALTPVSAAVVGLGAAAVKAWQEVDAGADTIAAKTGATGDALAEMHGIMEEIATTIPTTFETAGNAVGAVNTRFDLTGDALRDLSTEFIKFADLNNTEVSSSVDSVQKAMAAWGVETKDAGLYLDTLNAAAQKTGVSALTLANTSATNAAALKELGFTASDAAVFLGNLEKNGVDTSAAMTGLKKAYANALKDGGDLSSTLADLETRLRDESTHAEAAAEAIELFGSRAGGALAEAVSTGRLSFEQLGTTLQDYAGNVSSTFEETLDPLDEVKTAVNELKTAGSDLVEAAGPLIKTVVTGLSDGAKKLTGYLDKLNDKQKQSIVKMAAVVAAAGPVLTIIGKGVTGVGNMVSSVGKLMQTAPKITSALSSMSAGIGGVSTAAITATACVGAAVAAVAAVVEIRSSHTKKIFEETEALYGLTDAQKEENIAISEAAEATRQAELARQDMSQGIQSEYAYYQQLVEELQSITDENGNVKEGYEDRAEVITGTLANALGKEITMTDGVISNYDGMISKLQELIKQKEATALLEENQQSYTEALQKTQGAMEDYAKKYSEYISLQKEYDKVYEEAVAARTEYEKTGSEEAESAWGDLLLQLEALSGPLSEAKTAMENARDSWQQFQTIIANYEALEKAIESGEGLDEAMQNLAKGFMTAETASKEMLTEQAQAAVESFATMQDAVNNGMDSVTDAQLQAWAEYALKTIAEAEKAGVDMSAALYQAMQGMSPEVQEAVRALLEAAQPTGTDTSAWREDGGSRGQAEADGMSAQAPAVTAAAIALDTAAQPVNSGTGLWRRAGANYGTAFGTALGNASGGAQTAALTMAQGGVTGAQSKTGDMLNAGTSLGENAALGIQGTGGLNMDAGSYIAACGRTGTASVDLYPVGYQAGSNYALGLIAGMASKQTDVNTAAFQLGEGLDNSANAALGNASPSKKARRAAQYYGDGLILGMRDRMEAVAAASKQMATLLMTPVQTPTSMIRANESRQQAAEAAQRIVVDGVSQQSSGILQALASIRTKLDSLGIYLDGDTLVGGLKERIDAALGLEAQLQEIGI